MITINEASDKIKNFEVIINNINNVELLTKILDTAFNKEHNIGGYSKYYYRQVTGYFDGWINSSCYPTGRKTFLLSDVSKY